jgi:hypothetical protein
MQDAEPSVPGFSLSQVIRLSSETVRMKLRREKHIVIDGFCGSPLLRIK